MKTERTYPRAVVTPKAEAALLRGHPWVYDAEITALDGTPENGGLVDVVSKKDRYLGTGMYSEKSKIRLRLVSRNANDSFDSAFWERKLRWAWDYRKAVLREEDLTCCRIIFGEADGFPGLTVDRFGPILSVQVLSVGMEVRKELLFPLLVEVLRQDGQEISGVYERNDVALREKEGLPQYKGWFPLPGKTVPDSAVTEIVENGVKYLVDVENGQKTGFFLDQKFNRQAVARLSKGRTVLDCFTHTGSFALNAARGGAAHVTAVDVSESAGGEGAGPMPAATGWKTRWSAYAPTCSTCCQALKSSPGNTISLFWTLLRLQNPGPRWQMPSPAIRRLITGP